MVVPTAQVWLPLSPMGSEMVEVAELQDEAARLKSEVTGMRSQIT